MKKQFVISTFLCSFLILCSFSTVVPSSTTARSHYDWSDGTFQGVWNKQKDDTSGSLWGVLNQGRRATRGTISGEWNTFGGIDTGTFHGIFYGKMLIGQWNVIGTGKTTRLTGILRLNETHFSAQLLSPGVGLVDISRLP